MRLVPPLATTTTDRPWWVLWLLWGGAMPILRNFPGPGGPLFVLVRGSAHRPRGAFTSRLSK